MSAKDDLLRSFQAAVDGARTGNRKSTILPAVASELVVAAFVESLKDAREQHPEADE